MSKTAMQELLDKYKNIPHPSGVWSKLLINAFIKDIEFLIDKDKNQIASAYAAGFEDGFSDEKSSWGYKAKYKNGWDYYEQNYKTAVE